MKKTISIACLALSMLVISGPASCDILNAIYPSYANPFSEYWKGRHKQTLLKGNYESLQENDFVVSDRYYTNGASFMVSHVNPTPYEVTDDGLAKATPYSDPSKAARLETGYILYGQFMYTSDDMAERPEAVYNQEGDIIGGAPTYSRPYSGFSYSGLITRLYQQDKIESFGLMVGMLGPASGADSTQTWAHERIAPSSYKPRGWDTQVKNRPAIQMFRVTEYKDKIKADTASFSFYTAADYGTVFNRAGGGFTAFISTPLGEACQLVLGQTTSFPKSYELPGPQVPQDSESLNKSRTPTITNGCHKNRSYVLAFFRMGGKGVINNTLIDEGIHYDVDGDGYEETYPRQHASFYTEASAGVVFKFKSYFDVSVQYNVRSPELADIPYEFAEHHWAGLNFTIYNQGVKGLLYSAGFYGAIVAANSDSEDRVNPGD